jgi:apolipoprotein N-acyltransferase
MNVKFINRILPNWKNAVLAALAAVLLTLSFPDFEYWFLAWFALVPLMWAVEREKASTARSFVLGWLFGTIFFFGTCWWLTFAPITYAGFPWPLAYFLMLCVAVAVGIFPALFAGILSVMLRRFGSWGILAAPFVWVFTEFLRYWLTGNNWNAIGYSMAFEGYFLHFAALGGVAVVGFAVMMTNLTTFVLWRAIAEENRKKVVSNATLRLMTLGAIQFWLVLGGLNIWFDTQVNGVPITGDQLDPTIIALQPNVPMSGLDPTKWSNLRQRQVAMAELEITKFRERLPINKEVETIVVLPESPMNFMYEDDREFQRFINDFAIRNNVSVLFNSAEPDKTNGKYFNSAVMVGPQGNEAAQYDKIYLLPFGEAVPPFLEGIVPGFVGNFSFGREYDLLPLGDAKAGVMICFESHFGQLSRRYAQDGADVIIEMTNDGYLGPTPVLRQHLANAVFRAVETNRPVLRVTNVGITAYINERGAVLDAAPPYKEDTRVWSVAKSDGSQTFYVRYGDWFAWLCSLVTLGLVLLSYRPRRSLEEPVAEARTK